jgi:nanoRNase/pAp phosphatase (c-di-AMP/oligoRNAs hydrolase)
MTQRQTGAGVDKPGRVPGRFSVVVVAVGALVATTLLVRTERNAAHIRTHTARIAASARGINTSTDAIMQLSRTNERISAVLAAIEPVATPVHRIDAQSVQIADLLTAIRTRTSAIETSSASIDHSAGGIRTGTTGLATDVTTVRTRLASANTDAAAMLTELNRIRAGIDLLNTDLPAAEAVLRGILADTGNLLGALGTTEHYAACIDDGLNGGVRCSRTRP